MSLLSYDPILIKPSASGCMVSTIAVVSGLLYVVARHFHIQSLFSLSLCLSISLCSLSVSLSLEKSTWFGGVVQWLWSSNTRLQMVVVKWSGNHVEQFRLYSTLHCRVRRC